MKKKIIKMAFIFITQIQSAQFLESGDRIVLVDITLHDKSLIKSCKNYESAFIHAQQIAILKKCTVIIASWCSLSNQLTFHINPSPETIVSLKKMVEKKYFVYEWDSNNQIFQIKK